MNDIGVIISIPVSPVYINALVLFNGKLLPTFVNHTIIETRPTVSNDNNKLLKIDFIETFHNWCAFSMKLA